MTEERAGPQGDCRVLTGTGFQNQFSSESSFLLIGKHLCERQKLGHTFTSVGWYKFTGWHLATTFWVTATPGPPARGAYLQEAVLAGQELLLLHDRLRGQDQLVLTEGWLALTREDCLE